ncbi:hypothetical protein [Cysteiniphilum sp. QT6929]|uniref:hypothetical protein n=1 Tax=Cysteiniphilum sp. QT6929 TaxID=2975055 RepID=UPI0024B36CED|nr:hypothetical protein [Cysteiniphilum sp. QT6929]WHN65176.1 hypothetical protein NYP54_09015 [Cysteiniphilum sp. QT6929]
MRKINFILLAFGAVSFGYSSVEKAAWDGDARYRVCISTDNKEVQSDAYLITSRVDDSGTIGYFRDMISLDEKYRAYDGKVMYCSNAHYRSITATGYIDFAIYKELDTIENGKVKYANLTNGTARITFDGYGPNNDWKIVSSPNGYWTMGKDRPDFVHEYTSVPDESVIFVTYHFNGNSFKNKIIPRTDEVNNYCGSHAYGDNRPCPYEFGL